MLQNNHIIKIIKYEKIILEVYMLYNQDEAEMQTFSKT